VITLLVFGFLTGIDNAQVAVGLGMTAMSAQRKWLIAAMFGLFEATMPLIGLLVGHRVSPALGEAAGWLGPICLAACGLMILVMASRRRETDSVADSRWLMLGLPLSLSFDNLLAGMGFGALGYPVAVTAATIGLISGGLCFAGMFLGTHLRKWLPARADFISGAWLMTAATILILFD